MSKTGKQIGLGTGEVFPLLPLRDIVVFPHMIVPLFVGREKSIAALEEVMNSDRQILLFTQKNAGDDDPAPEALFETGTLATVLQLLKLPDGTVKVLVEGVSRARVSEFTARTDFHEARAEVVADSDDDPTEVEALARSVVSEFENYVKLNKKVSPGGCFGRDPDRGIFETGRHGCAASCHQDSGQAENPWHLLA